MWKVARFAVPVVAAVLTGALFAQAQTPTSQIHPPPLKNPNYVKPFPPLRIVGNLYYVGTYDLGVYLIATKEGNILVNTGINDSAPMIKANIEKLGFKYEDIKILLATHGHWDHVGAMAQIKRETGARMMMHEGDVGLVESGGGQDYRYPEGRGTIYEPVKVDRVLKEGDRVRLGETELTVIHHPGHTKGSTSFTFATQDAGKKYNVLIVNMGSINPGVNVVHMPMFPQITESYLATLARQKKLEPQVWVSSHAPQFDMHKKYTPGDAYDPNRFVDPGGYQLKIAFYEKLFTAALERDKAAKQ
jgi:metallo-beta-lactamase class B